MFATKFAINWVTTEYSWHILGFLKDSFLQALKTVDWLFSVARHPCSFTGIQQVWSMPVTQRILVLYVQMFSAWCMLAERLFKAGATRGSCQRSWVLGGLQIQTIAWVIAWYGAFQLSLRSEETEHNWHHNLVSWPSNFYKSTFWALKIHPKKSDTSSHIEPPIKHLTVSDLSEAIRHKGRHLADVALPQRAKARAGLKVYMAWLKMF